MNKLLTSIKKQTRFASVSQMALALLCSMLLMLSSNPAKAQSIAGRISFGIDGGGNKYYGDFTDNQFAFHGDAFIRWNILDFLSLHAAYNAGQLKYKATPTSIAYEAPVAAEALGDVNHTRVGGWDLMLSYNVFPEETFVPYVIAGIEALNFEPKNAADVSLRQVTETGAPIAKNVFSFVAGVGFEMYISEKITFNGKGLIHLPNTNYLDDYSTSPDAKNDAFLTFGLGFSYYIFAPMIVHEKDVDHSSSSTTNITNIYTTNIIRADTVVIRETDTVYKEKVKKNTIYNFPGTLFIVNTDEFNTSVPGNLQNLRNIKTLVNQCPGLKVEIQGHASHEGTVARNQELSEMRARKIKQWLIDQGVNPSKIASTVGLGTSDDAVYEPTNATPGQLEAARVLNRRIAVKVVEGCE